MPKKPRYFLLPIVLFFTLVTNAQTAPEAQSVAGKVICGYQGWFSCYGDGSPIERWFHWSFSNYRSDTRPSPGNVHVDIYPNISEYSAASLFQTNFANMPDGSASKLYSSWKPDVIDKHLEWMQQHEIDGIALQRFISETFDGVFKTTRDSISARVKRTAEKYQRIFYIMYDVSGLSDTKFDSIKNDWQNNMVNTLHLTSSPYYAQQNNKPVVCLWGFGFNDRPGTAAQCLDVINWFKANGCFVIGGVPTNWRTSNGDSKPGFGSVYDAYDMISPWSVGRFGDNTGADNFRTNRLVPDLAYCNSKNILYQPVVFSGFSWYNMGNGPQNQIPRNRGEFVWRQLYNIKQSGIGNMYVAMFDEFDEGTAIAKMADSYYAIPPNQYFLTSSADGTYISSDFYLRLIGKATKVIKGTDPLTVNVPIPNSIGPMWFRSGFEQGYDATINWADSPDPVAGNINVGGYLGSPNDPECSIVSETNHIGVNSLRYAGRDNSGTTSHYYYRVLDVDIPVNVKTRLSFWTYPQTALARYVSVDLVMTDGSTLRSSGATDINGISMHPATGRGAINTWQQTQSDIGIWLNGKTIDRVIIGYDHDAETGDFRGYVDDIVIDEGAGVVPIRLTTFQGNANDRSSNLWWATQNELNAANIIVERSFDGLSFISIAAITAKNSSGINNYQFTDNYSTSDASKIYYRLKFISSSGPYFYGKTITLFLKKKGTELVLSPNPAKNFVQLIFSSEENNNAIIEITDASGKLVLRQLANVNKGNNTLTVNGLGKLSKGLYSVQLINKKERLISSLLIGD